MFTAEALAEKYHMRISQRTVSSWMLYLGLQPQPIAGGRRMLVKKANRQADTILRKRKKIGLVAFIRQQRAVKKKDWVSIATMVEQLTKVKVYAYSISRVARRAHIR